MYRDLKILFELLPKKTKLNFALVQFLSLLSSLSELVSLGALYPFLLVITKPGLVFQNKLISSFLVYFGFASCF